MFVNKVQVEVRGVTADGCVVVVREIAEATSNISYEDAWKKAHKSAKQMAEQKLEEKLKSLNAECHQKVECLVGERGFPGPRGPVGPPGPAAPADTSASYYAYGSTTSIQVPPSLISKDGSKANCTLIRSDVRPFFLALIILQKVILDYGQNSQIARIPKAALNTFLEDEQTKNAFDIFLAYIIEYCPLQCMIENGLIFIDVVPAEYERFNVTIGISTAFTLSSQ